MQALEKLIQSKTALFPLNSIFSTNLQAGRTHQQDNCGSELVQDTFYEGKALQKTI